MPASVMPVSVHAAARQPFTFNIYPFIHLQDTGVVTFIQSVKSYYNAGTCNFEFAWSG